MAEPLDIRISASYDDLSGKLKQAADYLVENQIDVATRSLRSVAEQSNIAPASFSRLARALGYDDFGSLRGDIRTSIDRRVNAGSQRARQLSTLQQDGKADFVAAYVSACADNIHTLADGLSGTQLKQSVAKLQKARSVLVFGTLSSTGVAEHLNYMASLLFDNWSMAGRMGSSLGAGLAGLDETDVLILITQTPYSPRPVRAAELARDNGAFVVVITDTHACPALKHASASFIIPSRSPHFFSSYTATLFFVETLIGMLAQIGGERSRKRIAEVEISNRRLQEILDG
ncbi:MurR/RpiR family transcriptional regulator [Roseobacter sp. YSTF-M11]|uniref:MurR/RpiR family transcriptional regulator n=1 Tax=Roseobacter insulae TaxID=2859783 RepID=A0A9X1K091_9RHOB|nr:MurR/RpiR family transcriptional regulator [Roseobacter insulae]MBW4710025.1 MurR/RpiR family transcriptional regulator [Roseobacter insulae]